MIPETTLREIQNRIDIIEVVGGYIVLRKSGQNFKALCPFHPEKTPSFMVYPQKQFYICYGCGAGGDTISFVMRHEHMEFAEAVEALAQKAGVEIPRAVGKQRRSNPDMYRAQELAAKLYHEQLVSSQKGAAAREYLKKRGLDQSTWETFQLGYAPDEWDFLIGAAQKEGLSPEVLERGGLAVSREGKGGCYDRFRNRVIFPICDTRGRVIAFGGRVFGEESGPKYLNSPETELYVKGKILYGLHLAAPEIRAKDFCLVVEGYMDMVSPYQHGIHNVVASMGTSLTEAQIQLIRRYTRNVVMVYDGDLAGEMATLRGLDLLLTAQMRVKVTGLPGGLDPDSMIKAHGVKAFARAIQGSQDLFDYKLTLLRQKFDPKQMEGRVRICEEMLPTIKRVPNAIQRGEYVKRLSELLGVSEELVWAEYGKVRLESGWKPAGVIGTTAPKAPMSPEESLAGLLLENPAWIERLEDRLDPSSVKNDQARNLLEWLTGRWKAGQLPQGHQEVINALGRDSVAETEALFARWLVWAETLLEEDKLKALDGLIVRIQKDRMRVTSGELQLSIRQAEEKGDEETAVRLVLELNRLNKTGVPARAID